MHLHTGDFGKGEGLLVHNPAQEQTEASLTKDDCTSKYKQATYILKNKSALVLPCHVYLTYLS